MSDLKHPDNLAMQVLTMPSELNHHGTVFGGKMLSYLDQAGALIAMRRSKARVLLASFNETDFKQPVDRADVITIYGKVVKVGTSSMTVATEIWRSSPIDAEDCSLAATATIVYVAVGEDLRPIPVDR